MWRLESSPTPAGSFIVGQMTTVVLSRRRRIPREPKLRSLPNEATLAAHGLRYLAGFKWYLLVANRLYLPLSFLYLPDPTRRCDMHH